MLSKNEIINKISDDAHITKVAAAAAIDSFTQLIVSELVAGEKVSIHGFGTFTVKERAERKGRNPQTGLEMIIPAKKVVGFKSSSKVREAINN